jgi:bla regulator protein BlaR1
MRRLRHAKSVTNPDTLALFAHCKAAMGVSKAVRLAESEHVRSPALYGFVRPRLLFPVNLMGQFSAAEQRHIFLHELAHEKA